MGLQFTSGATELVPDNSIEPSPELWYRSDDGWLHLVFVRPMPTQTMADQISGRVTAERREGRSAKGWILTDMPTDVWTDSSVVSMIVLQPVVIRAPRDVSLCIPEIEAFRSATPDVAALLEAIAGRPGYRLKHGLRRSLIFYRNRYLGAILRRESIGLVCVATDYGRYFDLSSPAFTSQLNGTAWLLVDRDRLAFPWQPQRTRAATTLDLATRQSKTGRGSTPTARRRVRGPLLTEDEVRLGAIFSRNHLKYLVAAAKRPMGKKTTFRARKPWSSAAELVKRKGSCPIFICPIDSQTVQYQAQLVEVLLHPRRKPVAAKKMLRHELKETQREGLWDTDARGKVITLYAIVECRKLPKSFRFDRLIKLRGGKALDAAYRYDYALVKTDDPTSQKPRLRRA